MCAIGTVTLQQAGLPRQACALLPLEHALGDELVPAGPHRRDHYAILFLAGGAGSLNVDTRMYRLEGEGVLVLQPHTVHLFHWERIPIGEVLLFTPEFFSVRYNNNVLAGFHCLGPSAGRYVPLETDAHRTRIVDIRRIIREEVHGGRNDSPLVLRSALNMLLVELDRMIGSARTTLDKRAGPLKLKAFLALVEEEFKREKNPSEYARRLHITPNYLNKLTREHHGSTAGDVIRDRVVLEAERLLRHTDLAVNQIADELGYENVPWFITFFKRSTGHSPKQYRELT